MLSSPGPKPSPYNFKDPIIPKGPGASTSPASPVLDLGSGCGAVSLAVSLSGAMEVIANDIDKNMKIALKVNCDLNSVKAMDRGRGFGSRA